MKAAYLSGHGGVEALSYGDLPDPVPGPGQAVVRVRACGLNYLDLWVRRGLPFLRVAFPFVLGVDIAGEVAAIGPDANAPPVGTRVLVCPGISCGRCELCLAGSDHLCPRYQLLGHNLNGGYAELVRVPAENLVPLPGGVSWETAACLPAAFGTAWSMLVDKAALQPGEWVLVHAGGSGVGSAAIQVARVLGASVITTAGTDEKLEKARALGAHHAINYKTHDFLREVRRITEGRGVDVVVEHIGADVWERSLQCLAHGGRLVTCGATSGFQARTDLRYVFSRNLRILGNSSGSRASVFRIAQLVQQGKFVPVLDRVFPLREARLAHEVLEGRQQFGKVLLVPE